VTRILHFADAHIDIVTHGRHDPQTGLPVRTLDFLKSLDTIVDAAIAEHVDLVIFAGDAYKDRTPVPTFQREWGRRIVRLSQAGIPTLLLVGNHDLSPAAGRAHAMQEFETIPVPHIQVISRPCLLGPEQLEGLPLQVIGLPWVSRSSMMAAMQLSGADPGEVFTELETRLTDLVHIWLDQANPDLPVIMVAHASIQGAVYGGERSVMLGSDLVLPGSLVRDPRLSYVALGHIHKPQDLNQGAQPPVIYPGSIERVDFGEPEERRYILAEVNPGKPTKVEWRALSGRRFIDCAVRLKSAGDIYEHIIEVLPAQEELNEAIVRLVIEYPVEWETMLNEMALRRYAESCFEFHLIRRPQREARLRLPNDSTISSLTPLDLLDVYWRSLNTNEDDSRELQKLAQEVISGVAGGSGNLDAK
jgi:DNA repair protein SbcD/Mre11